MQGTSCQPLHVDGQKSATWEDVARMDVEGRLVFVLEDRVYCVNEDFLHPGGNEILAEHSGKDITDLFSGEYPLGHAHSSAAHHLLEKFYIGSLTANLPTSEDQEQQQQPFLIDESRPLLWQVGSLGTHYMDWVESPVPGQPRFFESNWAEAVTKTPWWVVPLLWLPVVAHQLLFKATSSGNYSNTSSHSPVSADDLLLSSTTIMLLVVLGIVIWQVNAMAPTRAVAGAVFGGIMLGYVAYDCMHYWMHSGLLHGPLKAAHMRHHYIDSSRAYGISSPLFDFILGTMGPMKK
ncbi:putative Dihydroceramide fatty acyl 2-hydroxylase FAH2 [Nannochloris sp. 'desiccata']|nr:hypothetical protein KSW81_007251 [Chlorella desiccata (nom. nud.)]KAH7621627.1 putative Dihydroceramide fatty acyl 2-hydroxylase FAH2 [Chlorella desiccata (nom. nud.)]